MIESHKEEKLSIEEKRRRGLKLMNLLEKGKISIQCGGDYKLLTRLRREIGVGEYRWDSSEAKESSKGER